MLALIDADIVRYRTGFASQDTSEAIACVRANETIEQIIGATGATSYRIFLSDANERNFRTAIYPAYKASRLTQPKPVHHRALGQFLQQEWQAEITQGQEADDALGIAQTSVWDYESEYGVRSVICSIDKDLMQVPGLHYNWVKGEFYEQNYHEGLRRFYEQCLSGDRTDDVAGIQGIGPVKARRALEGCGTEEEMIEVCLGMWNDDAMLQLVGSLLWVRRYEGEMWQIPFITQDTKPKSSSLNTTPRENDQSSVLGTQEVNGAPELGSQTDVIMMVESQP